MEGSRTDTVLSGFSPETGVPTSKLSGVLVIGARAGAKRVDDEGAARRALEESVACKLCDCVGRAHAFF